jgi:ribose 5-phosphate isomerase A
VEPAERLHRLAVAAADLVKPGMLVGLGTGSTASTVIEELGRRVAEGLTFTGVATSSRTENQARQFGICLTRLDDVNRLDLGIDGADEIDPALNAIKGRGGALLMEKLVALACDQFVLVASTEKNVDRLGERMPLPVEIVSFGWAQTAARLAEIGMAPELRRDQERPFTTDNGGYILDCVTGPMDDPMRLAAAVKETTGVVEHGLFLGVACMALQVDPEGAIVQRERSTD